MTLARSASRIVVFCLLPLTATAQPSAVESAAEQRILAAARTLETKHDLELCSYGFLQYDKSQPVGTFAYFRERARPDLIALRRALFQSAGKTWMLEIEPTGPYGNSCTGTGDVPRRPLQAQRRDSLPLNGVEEGGLSTLSVTLFDQELVVINENGRKPELPDNQSWRTLRYYYGGYDGDPGGHHEYGTVLVLPKGSALRKTVPPLATYVVRGQRATPGDADLDVVAELVGDQIDLTVTVTDDKDVPLRAATASNADLLRSDHLELWHQCGPKAEACQLGVARLADGQVHARWLHPRKVTAPLPKVSSERPGKFVLTYPAAQLFNSRQFFADSGDDSAFTAVFSDTDDPRKRQETVVASSTIKWGRPFTFGKIVWFPKGARFPAFPESNNVKLTVTGPGIERSGD